MELIACLVWSYATTKAPGIATKFRPRARFCLADYKNARPDTRLWPAERVRMNAHRSEATSGLSPVRSLSVRSTLVATSSSTRTRTKSEIV